MAATTFDIVVLGGGNAAGYFADAWIKAGGSGKVAIVGEEPVSAWTQAHVTSSPCRPPIPLISSGGAHVDCAQALGRIGMLAAAAARGACKFHSACAVPV